MERENIPLITESASIGVIVGGFIGGAGSPLVVIGLSLMLLFGGEIATKDIIRFKSAIYQR
jgi:hypothetical protein